MKLSYALGIVLASSPSGTAFAPAVPGRLHAASFQYNDLLVGSPYTIATPASCASTSTCLSMVGGGMIERPPGGDDSSDNDDDDDTESDTGLTSSRTASADPYSAYNEEKDKFLAKLGRDIDIDPWDPNPYIKPRPGKYGWNAERGSSAAERLAAAAKPSDEEIAARGQTMTDSEREENLNVIRRLRQNDVPTLRRSGDLLAAAEAAADANAREKEDPWYDLNERLGDAIKYETEDVEKLKALIAKVGGPPPQLVKYADNPRGYVLRSEIIGMQMSNERLERMIERRMAMEDEEREEQRRELVKKQMSKLDYPAKEESQLAEIEEIARRREEAYLRGIMDIEGRTQQYMDMMKEETKEYEKRREELLKRLGATGEGGEDVEFMSAQSEFVDKTMKNFVQDLKRMNNLYEDDDDEDDLGFGDTADALEEAYATKPMSKAAQARAEAMKNDGSGRPRLPGDPDVTRGEIDPDLEINQSSSATTGPLTVEVTSAYNSENSDPPMRKHCFQYTVRITNDSATDTVQLLSRRFEIQTVGSSMKDVVQGEGVTGRQPVLKPGEVFEYTSTAPLSVRPIGTTEIAARMSGEYRYCVLQEGQDKATDEQVNEGQGEAGAELATFHFVFPEEQRVKPVRPSDDDDDDDDDDGVKTTTVTSSAPAPSPPAAKDAAPASPGSPASSLPGEPDMTSGNISSPSPNDSSDTLTSDVRVAVTSTYRPERSDANTDKHCFAYNVRITNESSDYTSIQLVSRRFEIQTVGSASKDVVQGPGVTGRQPVLKPGESFEYTSTAPLSVRPMLDRTRVVARMSGEYNFVRLADDGKTPLSSNPLKAELGAFHFILPE